MSGSALNLALKLVVLNVELQNVKHGDLHGAPIEVTETQILFHWIGLKKLAYKLVNYNIVCGQYPEIPGEGVDPPPNLI